MIDSIDGKIDRCRLESLHLGNRTETGVLLPFSSHPLNVHSEPTIVEGKQLMVRDVMSDAKTS